MRKPKYETLEKIEKFLKKKGEITLPNLIKKGPVKNFNSIMACLNILDNKGKIKIEKHKKRTFYYFKKNPISNKITIIQYLK